MQHDYQNSFSKRPSPHVNYFSSHLFHPPYSSNNKRPTPVSHLSTSTSKTHRCRRHATLLQPPHPLLITIVDPAVTSQHACKHRFTTLADSRIPHACYALTNERTGEVKGSEHPPHTSPHTHPQQLSPSYTQPPHFRLNLSRDNFNL